MPTIEMTNEQIQNNILLLGQVHVTGTNDQVAPIIATAQALQELFRSVLVESAINEPAEKEKE